MHLASSTSPKSELLLIELIIKNYSYSKNSNKNWKFRSLELEQCEDYFDVCILVEVTIFLNIQRKVRTISQKNCSILKYIFISQTFYFHNRELQLSAQI